jgi:hypothetical protein
MQNQTDYPAVYSCCLHIHIVSSAMNKMQDISWKFVGWGIAGQVAGHGVAWGLAGTSVSKIISPASLMAVGLSLGSELAGALIGNDGLLSLAPNVAQVGAIAGMRGIQMDTWTKDPQLLGSIGSGVAKTIYAFQG